MALEDFTTYAEVDEDGDIAKIANKITVVTMRRDALSYVRKDKGVNHFGDFEHLVHVKVTQCDSRAALNYWAVNNGYNTSSQMDANNDGIHVIGGETSVGDFFLYLEEEVAPSVDSYDALLNTDYYLTIKRLDTTATCKIYSDAARTVLLDTLTLACDTRQYRYIFGLASHEYGTYPTVTQSCTVEDLDLQEIGAVGAGAFIWDGSNIVELERDDASPVQMWTGSEIVGIALVDLGDPNATPIAIWTGSAIKYLKKI